MRHTGLESHSRKLPIGNCSAPASEIQFPSDLAVDHRVGLVIYWMIYKGPVLQQKLRSNPMESWTTSPVGGRRI